MEAEANTVMTLKACLNYLPFTIFLKFFSFSCFLPGTENEHRFHQRSTLARSVLRECHPSPWKDVAAFLTTLSHWSTPAVTDEAPQQLTPFGAGLPLSGFF